MVENGQSSPAAQPPSVGQTLSILRGLRPRYEQFHGVTITEAALVAAAALSHRYIAGRQLPDKAIDCIDEATAQVRVCAAARWWRAQVPACPWWR